MKNLLLTTFALLVLSVASASANATSDAQRMLNQLGYNAGPVDGAYGGKTKRALEAFYTDNGTSYDGTLDANEVSDLKAAAVEAGVKLNVSSGISVSDQYRFENFAGLVSLPYANSIRRSWFGYIEIPLIDTNDDGYKDLVFNSDGPDFFRQQKLGKNDANVVTVPYNAKWKDWDMFETVESPNSTFGNPMMQYADMNGDGRVDIVAATSVPGGSFNEGGAVVYFNQGDGTFKTKMISRKKFTHALAIGDLDGDGDQDVIYHHLGATSIQCEINDGRGNFKRKNCMRAPKTFNQPYAQNIWSFRIADFDNDGAQDVSIWTNVGSSKVDNSWGQVRQNELQHPTIFWGDNNVKFSYKNKTSLDVTPWTDGALQSGKPVFLTANAGTTVDIGKDGDVDLVTILVGKHSVGGALVIHENLGNRQFRTKELSRSVFLKNDPDRFRTMQDKTGRVNTTKDYTWLTESLVWNDMCGNVMFLDINNDGIDDFVCGGTGWDDNSVTIIDRWDNHQKEHQRIMPWMNTKDWNPDWSSKNRYAILDINGNVKDSGKIFNNAQSDFSAKFKSRGYKIDTIGF
jgi:peptidoglycan hydrolase-like protein with peptidoglycan-binding domain